MTPRLFRAMTVILALVLLLRGGELWRRIPAEAADAAEAAEAVEVAPTEEAEPKSDAATNVKYDDAGRPDECATGKDFTGETGLSQYEIQLLRNLSRRRESLDERSRKLDTRAKTIEAAGVKLTERIEELRLLESDMQQLLADMESRNNERMNALVRVYEAMKPKDAARIFNSLDDAIMLDVAVRMKHAALSVVLAKMDPDRARKLTTMMAGQTKLPKSVAELQEQAG